MAKGEPLLDSLLRWAQEIPGRRFVFVSPKSRKPRRLAFCQPNNRPLDGRPLTRWHFRRLIAKANQQADETDRGVGKISSNLRFHHLPHIFVSGALPAGANVRAVSEVVGYCNRSFTLKRYVHVLLNDVRGATQRVEKYLKLGEE